jgi:8-oxo-dGTP diphosphatase
MANRDRPLVGVSVLVRRGRDVLLVRRARPPLQGIWAFPGGRVEWGETLAAAARREVREEAGIDIEITDQIDTAEIIGKGADGAVDHHFVLVVFAGRFISGNPLPGDDAAEARWFAPADLAGLEMTADTRRILMRENERASG